MLNTKEMKLSSHSNPQMNYNNDSMSKLHYKRVQEFDKWWDENRVKIEQNNLHSFSGLVRNNMEKDYYYTYWNLMNQFIRLEE
jgi:hypothetical protein